MNQNSEQRMIEAGWDGAQTVLKSDRETVITTSREYPNVSGEYDVASGDFVVVLRKWGLVINKVKLNAPCSPAMALEVLKQ